MTTYHKSILNANIVVTTSQSLMVALNVVLRIRVLLGSNILAETTYHTDEFRP
jgi:hypothetical protein